MRIRRSSFSHPYVWKAILVSVIGLQWWPVMVIIETKGARLGYCLLLICIILVYKIMPLPTLLVLTVATPMLLGVERTADTITQFATEHLFQLTFVSVLLIALAQALSVRRNHYSKLSQLFWTIRAFGVTPTRLVLGFFVISACLALWKSHYAPQACCTDLGCFDPDGDFRDLAERPINIMPNCGLRKNLKLHLTTRLNPEITQIISHSNFSTMGGSNFDVTKRTLIMVNGYMASYQDIWFKQIVRALLVSGDYNIVRLDWGYGNGFPYFQAVANVRVIGSYIATFLDHIVRIGVKPADIHFIGHSLGAHAAGYAGLLAQTKFGFKVGRITGLDPAGPYFSKLPAGMRLGPGDAEFVDTIVTDGDGFSTLEPMGHANFYPNGGLRQPGCHKGHHILDAVWLGPSMNTTGFGWTDIVYATAADIGLCDHMRAIVLFHETINHPACMKFNQCTDYASYIQGQCGSCGDHHCSVVGFHASPPLATSDDNKPINYYAVTKDKAPFCDRP